MPTPENERLIREYLDIAVNASEDLGRFSALLSDDCIWYLTPPGIAFQGKLQVQAFAGRAMGSRQHDAGSMVEIRNWFADDENLCVEYFHAARITPLHIRVTETVCLVCHMCAGKFDRIHEYVDTSRSLLIRLGLGLLPLMVKKGGKGR
jgi:ketosteroid isomerase-like protein